MTNTSSVQEAQPRAVALFISDLHLQASLPRTTQAFHDFLDRHASRSEQLYLLGDIFEYWAGDDDIETPYNRDIVNALRRVSDSGVAVFWIAGNRDFLVGPAFAEAAGLTILEDPHVIRLAGRDITLAHGDAQCTDDTAYMAFRAQVRQPAWQQHFLGMPLAQRKAIIEGVRQNSKDANKEKSYEIMDVNADAIREVYEQTGTQTLIHGHTHRPALHVDESGAATRLRYVLPDWEYDVEPARGGWMSLTADGVLHRFDAAGNELT
ncbi:UDP-2,3-diacylglucosamine diphosphatase [Herbaspirillum rhizosphaerae]|uniref:UDP-2,3-diacylglucosamine diphosphatase n=1 Tax=Herbaspirillum rhizosphaerae TaxID=346179 RepID=UPI00067DF5D3|nr:UDP-2,3-diacylglucosamine diphosphatase [Herbaspirillum rhizosphaerae]